nr:unnamed protein product [Callosobruchus chinensis]
MMETMIHRYANLLVSSCLVVPELPYSCEGQNTKSLKYINYPNLPSAIRPVPHDADIPVPIPPKVVQSVESEPSKDSEIDIFEPSASRSHEPQLFSQSELNDLVRDLGLPKDLSEILGSRLRDKGLPAADANPTVSKNKLQKVDTGLE